MARAALATTVLAILFLVACDAAPKCELHVAIREWQAYDCGAADIDGDGVDELLTVDEANLSARNLDLSFDWQTRSPVPDGARCHLFLGNADTCGNQRYVLAVSVAESLVICMDKKHVVLLSRPRPSGLSVDWDAGFDGADFADLNGDGDKDLIVAVGSGYAWPWTGRALYAVDCKNGRIMWRYGLGPVARGPVTADLDRDGWPEVLVGTGAVGNGCFENGTADTCAYVICLDRFGQRRWLAPLRSGVGSWTEVEVADLTGDGSLDVLAVEGSCLSDTTTGRIILLSPDDGTVLRQEPVGGIRECRVVADLDADGDAEIVTMTRTGAIEVRDHRLKTIQTSTIVAGIDRVGACDHLLGTAKRQIVVVTQAGTLEVLDDKLRTLAALDFSRAVEEVRPVHIGKGRPMGLLVATAPYTRGSHQPNWVLLHLSVLPQPFPWAVVSGVLALLLVAGMVSLVYTQGQHRRQMRGLTGGLVQKAGVVELDRKGRVLSANYYARQLLGLEGDWERQVLVHTLTAPEFSPLREALQRIIAGAEQEVTFELPLPVDGECVLSERESHACDSEGSF